MLNGPRSRVVFEGLRASFLMLFVVAIPLAAAYVVGMQLPEEHTATASGVVQASPARVWELLTDFSAQENWRNGPLLLVRGAKREANYESCWLEGWLLAKITFCAVDAQQDRRRVVRTLGAKLPFDATWTFDLSPNDASGTATTLTITEHATIDPPLWRFFGQYVLRGHTAASQYLSDLQAEALHHP